MIILAEKMWTKENKIKTTIYNQKHKLNNNNFNKYLNLIKTMRANKENKMRKIL